MTNKITTDKSGHVLVSRLLSKSLQEDNNRHSYLQPRYLIPFETYDTEDESSIIYGIEACYISSIKLILFVIISLTIIPLLLVKWSNKVYRLLLLSHTDINHATKLIIHGSCNFTSNHRWI
jgi:hypothetical protein